MSSEEPLQDAPSPAVAEMPQPPTGPAAMAVNNKKRPRLDLAVGAPERKRGKTVFGLLVGTLNKAKIEDKERSTSEAAKKRQILEQRLQTKLRKETDSVRRAEEAKKDKTAANRKEEDLQLRDSIYKYRRTRLPLLANFLITSDDLTSETAVSSQTISALPTRSHPPPLYYRPTILTSAQEAFLERRKAEVSKAAETEWQAFREERETGIKDIKQLRERVAEEEARRKAEKKQENDEMMDTDAAQAPPPPPASTEDSSGDCSVVPAGTMDVDKHAADGEEKNELDRKEEPSTMQADDEEAVEY